MNSRITKGFTLIELLVALSIIGIMIALLLPAVMSARESSRKSQCNNNLKQIGLALHSYHSVHNVFPYYMNNYWFANLPPNASRASFAAHVRLLPYLEQAALANSINYDLEGYGLTLVVNLANQTSRNTTVRTFLCPSDGTAFPEFAGNNYRGNLGIGPQWGPNVESPDSGGGFYDHVAGTIGASAFHDGLSHTIAYSERVRGTGTKGGGVPERDYSPLNYTDAPLRDADFALQWCRVAAREFGMTHVKSGEMWILERREFTSYCHAQEPNGSIPDSLQFDYPTSWGISTARSMHFGGVNALAADGSTRFVQETINRNVWRALGTRAGGELVD